MHFNLPAFVFAAGIFSAVIAQDIPYETPLSSLLDSAQTHLSRGEISDALILYDAAIQRDPTNYLSFFKRATAFLSLGRASQATDDFTKALALKPDFDAAHVQLGKIKQRAADWDGARAHFEKVKVAQTTADLSAALDRAEGAAKLAEAAETRGNWEECVNQAGVAILVASRAASLRDSRARCHLARGEVEEAMGDLQHVLQIKPGDVSPHLVISAVNFYALGDLEKGTAQMRKCLQSDPDSKLCRALFKQEKATEKILGSVDKYFGKNKPSAGTKLLVPSGESPGLIQDTKDQIATLQRDGILPASAPEGLLSRLTGLACQGYYEMNSKKAKDWCDAALQLDKHSLYGLLYQHKRQLDAELHEAAIETLKGAKEAHPAKSHIIDPLAREAQMLLRRSKTKDYYKVLGVSRDADGKQIKSAYRKLSKLHHPDKAAKQGLTKEEAEKKMASINEAYEVLSNAELRSRFDQGDDPMSNEQHNPFQGSPFGGGRQQQPFVFQQGGRGQQQFKFQFGSGGHGGPGGFPFGG